MDSPPGMRCGPVDPTALGRLRRLPCDARSAGLPQNSHRSLRSLCSDSCGKLDNEARVSCGTRAADCPALLGGAEGIARPAPHAGLRVGL